jgi:DNA polymerase-3 subunit gamma/tau
MNAPATALPDTGPTRTHGALALAEPATPGVRPSEAPRSVVVSLPKVAPTTTPPPPPAPGSPLPATPPDMEAWRAIVEAVRRVRPPLASVLEHALPLQVGPDALVVGFEASAAFLCARASEPEALDALTRAARSHFGRATRVEIDASARPAAKTRTLAAIAAEVRGAEVAKARAAVEGHPLVRDAIRLFDAQLRDVKLPGMDG